MSEGELEFYEIDEVWFDLGYINRRAALRAIRVGKFPLPYFELAGRKVVDQLVFHTFFRKQRETGLNAIGYKLTNQS